MAAVAEGAPSVEVSAVPELPDSEQGAEDVKKTIISLSELVDLALCTPEPGAVNFNLLRSVLHALVQRLDLVDIKAEILDEDTDNVFSQIMENADKLGLKDLRARQAGSIAGTDSDRPDHRADSRERRHKSRRSDRSRGGSSRRGSSERAPSQSRPAEEQRGPLSGAGVAGEDAGRDAGALGEDSGRDVGAEGQSDSTPDSESQKSRDVGRGGGVSSGRVGEGAGGSERADSGARGGGGTSSSGGEHSDEFDDVRDTFCPPDSAGQPDVARSRSLSGQRAEPDTADPTAATIRRPSSSGTARRSASAAGGAGQTVGGEEERGERGRKESQRISTDGKASADSIVISSGLSSPSDTESGRGSRQARKATLSELASERLRRSGRQSAVSIGTGIEGTAVLADYTNLDRLEKKLSELQQKLEVMQLAEVLPRVRQLQTAISGSQEDVQGLWQSLQLMKKVDANEEGIDRLSQVIEATIARLKKVRKHTDRLDKQLAELVGQRGDQQRTSADARPVTLAEMEARYTEIRGLIDGLLSSLGQDSAPSGDAEQTERRLRSVGAGIVTWGVLGSALENIRGEVREMSEVNDRALTAVEQTQTEARQQELLETADQTSQVSKVKQLLANLSRLVDKHRALEKRVLQMEEAMGENFSDKVLEQLTLLKASASQIQDLRNKLQTGSGPQSAPSAPVSGGRGALGHGWSDLDLPASPAGSLGDLVTADLSVNLTSLREPSEMDLHHLADWLSYNKARMQQLESALVAQSEQVRDFGDRLGDQVVSFRDKLERVERELAGMLGRVTSAAQKSGMSREDSQALRDAYAKLQSLQMDVEALSSVSKKIVSDRGQIDDELSMLIRALEELKECKVDRATLDELIETKADRSSVEKKVSSWQFEQACQELSDGLATMLDKMTSQEVDWARSVDEINADLHRKLDRLELAPLRRYINSRLKNIMSKLNRLIAEDESPDACTTRRKIIRNLACLSCDEPQKVTGHTGAPAVPLLDPFPPSLGDRHQIAYRLGHIRRYQQMRCEPCRELTGHPGVFRSHIRREMDLMTHRGIPHHPSCPRYQNRSPQGRCTCVATRYCGGSHTRITCLDSRERRVGLGAPLLPFGAADSAPRAPTATGQGRGTRSSSAVGQRPPPPAVRRPSSRAVLLPSSPSPGPRQARSTGSGLRRKRRSAAALGVQSAPGCSVTPEGKGEVGMGEDVKMEMASEKKMEVETVEETSKDTEDSAREIDETVESKTETMEETPKAEETIPTETAAEIETRQEETQETSAKETERETPGDATATEETTAGVEEAPAPPETNETLMETTETAETQEGKGETSGEAGETVREVGEAVGEVVGEGVGEGAAPVEAGDSMN